MIEATQSEHGAPTITPVLDTPSHFPSWPLIATKTIMSPTAAIFSSLSVPISIIAIEKRFYPNAHLSLEEKLIKTMVPYSISVVFRTWLAWYRIGARLDGNADMPIISSIQDEDRTVVVIAGMIANISAFNNGLLIAFLQFKNASNTTALTAGFLIGTLNYIAELLTDVGDAFRKYSEKQKHHGKDIKPFFKQKLIQYVFEHHIEKYGMLLREVLPIIHGIIRAKSTADIIDMLFESKLDRRALNLLKLIFAISSYQASAYFTKFDLIQLHENLKACQLPNFPLENILARSPNAPIRSLGKLLNGQLLLDGFQKAFCAIENSIDYSVNCAYVFASIAFMTLIFSILQEYVSSIGNQAVREDNQGLLMSYYFGSDAAIEVAPKAFIGCVCAAVTLGAVGIFAQTATIKKYAKQRALEPYQAQIMPEHQSQQNINPDDIEAIDDRVMAF